MLFFSFWRAKLDAHQSHHVVDVLLYIFYLLYSLSYSNSAKIKDCPSLGSPAKTPRLRNRIQRIFVFSLFSCFLGLDISDLRQCAKHHGQRVSCWNLVYDHFSQAVRYLFGFGIKEYSKTYMPCAIMAVWHAMHHACLGLRAGIIWHCSNRFGDLNSTDKHRSSRSFPTITPQHGPKWIQMNMRETLIKLDYIIFIVVVTCSVVRTPIALGFECQSATSLLGRGRSSTVRNVHGGNGWSRANIPHHPSNRIENSH